MKKFKIFFRDQFVSEFNTFKECKEYINDMLNTDAELFEGDFSVYKYVFY